MIICRNCGHENLDDPTFCTNCGEFLPWDDAARADAQAGELAVGVHASLIRDDLRVTAGDEMECEIQVRNTGRVVDHFTIEILGPTATWADADPNALQLMPNDEATALIRFRPPRSPAVPAGRIPFTVQVVSRADPTVVELIHSNLDLEGV